MLCPRTGRGALCLGGHRAVRGEEQELAVKNPARKARKAGGKRSSGSRPSGGTAKRPSGKGAGPRKRTKPRSRAARATDGGKPGKPPPPGRKPGHLTEKKIAALKAEAEKAADMYCGLLDRLGIMGHDRFHRSFRTGLEDIFRASFEEDASRSAYLEQLAIAFVLDAAGVRRLRASEWRAHRNANGTWSLAKRFPRGQSEPPVTPPEPMMQTILNAVLERPRDLDVLRRVIAPALKSEKKLVTLSQFLHDNHVPPARIKRTKERWRLAKRDGRKALPPPAKRGKRGQPDLYDPDTLNAGWRAFQSEDIL